jgi:hypothetical protein
VFGQGAGNSGFVLILNKPRDFGKIALAGHIKIFDRILRAQCALVQEIMEISVKPVDKSTVNMPLFQPLINLITFVGAIQSHFSKIKIDVKLVTNGIYHPT